MTYGEALEFIHSTLRFGSKPGLSRVSVLLRRLGNPEKQLKFVHVAGTNGKGSTCAMIASALSKCGYKTGLFISPALEDFRERMSINGEIIGKDELADITGRVKNAWDAVREEISEAPTEFELVTAVGLVYFLRNACDIVVLEVGMGGRFDATNVIPPPEAAVIGSISFDHTAQLGNTIERIAFEKSGIIKPGAAVISYCEQRPEALEVIKKTAALYGIVPVVPDIKLQKTLSSDDAGSHISYNGLDLHIPFAGRHQICNALSAVEVLLALQRRGWRIDKAGIEQGIAAARMEGRFEILGREPLRIIDVGHNADCIDKLCETLDKLYPGKKIYAVMGMFADKDCEYCIGKIAARSECFYAVQTDSARALPAEETAKIAAKNCGQVILLPDAYKAAKQAIEKAGTGGLVLACGSFSHIAASRRAMSEAVNNNEQRT